uniref:Uncharacterized protein n=1 Tax=Phlebotomus papatasi TaxID=29031 RepID=A0A1B0FYA2_PHLPP
MSTTILGHETTEIQGGFRSPSGRLTMMNLSNTFKRLGQRSVNRDLQFSTKVYLNLDLQISHHSIWKAGGVGGWCRMSKRRVPINRKEMGGLEKNDDFFGLIFIPLCFWEAKEKARFTLFTSWI